MFADAETLPDAYLLLILLFSASSYTPLVFCIRNIASEHFFRHAIYYKDIITNVLFLHFHTLLQLERGNDCGNTGDTTKHRLRRHHGRTSLARAASSSFRPSRLRRSQLLQASRDGQGRGRLCPLLAAAV